MLPKIFPVTSHTDHVGPNSTFVAIPGFKENGNQYINKAIELGATKIVFEKATTSVAPYFDKLSMSGKCVEYVEVKNARIALAELSSQALNNPASKLKIIGITGTKGKTTTTYIVEHILRHAGFKTALIGTIKNKILNQEVESDRTTPENDYLQMFFAQCVKLGVEYVVMEVSSHALSLHRVHGIKFEAVGFTNLAPEHLDFYENMQNYFDAKFQIFKQLKTNSIAVLNTDDEWGKKALNLLSKKHTNHQLIHLKKEFFNKDAKSPRLLGEFNDYNLNMSFLICKALGIDQTKIKAAINTFPGTPGRLQLYTLKNGSKAVVDYAHNPSSMEAILKTLRPLTKDLIVVFGCGGDRDKTKRPVMGKLASEYGNKIIVTSDNPRSEEPEDIIKQVLQGIPDDKTKDLICEVDRRIAIQKAAELSGPNSIIALLGKGHENYFLIKDKKLHFDDFEEISKF